MTEKDLLEYVRIEREIERLCARYRQEMARMGAPRSPDITGAGRGSGNDDPLMEALDRRRVIKERIDLLKADRVVASRRVDKARAKIGSELELEVFDALYRDGMTIREACDYLHYSKSHIYRARTSILSLIESL